MKKISLLLLFALSFIRLSGQEIVTIDNIKYYLENGEATVMTQDQSLSGNIEIPESITYNEKWYIVSQFAESAFRDTNISKIVVPKTITSLSAFCFDGCTYLSDVVLPNSITELGANCFSYCTFLESISLPESITSLPPYCFQGCRFLISVNLPNGIKSLSMACFYGCESLVSITLPSGLTTLGDQCFRNCYGLEFIILPHVVQTLGNECFRGCRNLPSIILPENISNIGYSCFFCCPSLCQVECNWTDLSDLTFGTGIFSGIFSQAKLYVPRGTKELYASTEPWASSFSAIIEKENGGEEPKTPQCAAPSVLFENGKLAFTSETEGAEFHYTLQTPDAKNNAFAEDGTIDLACQYDITVWASADGYTNSETTKVTIFFIDAKIESETTDISLQSAKRGIVITMTSNGLAMSGLNASELVEVYNLQGAKLAQSQATNGTLFLKIPSSNGIVMLKVGNETIKVRL